MDNTFVVNIIHRPELSPEYAEKALGKGKGVQDESLDIFRFQQDCSPCDGYSGRCGYCDRFGL